MIICFYVFTDFPRVSEIKERAGLIGVTTDILGRVCGVNEQPDFTSPRVTDYDVGKFCLFLDYPTDCDAQYLKRRLSATGTYSVSAMNGSVCVEQVADCKISLDYSYAVDDIYEAMVNHLRTDKYTYKHPQFITKSEFISDSQLLLSKGEEWIL